MNGPLQVLEGWVLACAPALLLGLAILALLIRQAQLRQSAHGRQELAAARTHGSHEARLLHPEIDLSKCIGCGACVRACPEQGVLSLLNGQAAVIHGSRCVGHGECAAACPTGAILLTLGDLTRRRDLPALEANLQAAGVPGLFLAGELSGFALVRTAVSQGVAVADAVARRVAAITPARALQPIHVGAGGGDSGGEAEDLLDLLIVGAGPGGLACSLRAKQQELVFLTIEQESRIGGTIAAYPRKKMVMTQPLDLPLYGRLPELTYSKEELVALWEHATRANQLPVRTGVKLLDLTRSEDGVFTATTSDGAIRARNVCLALGRRGSPRKLGVSGEDLPKVAYSLLDAASYKQRRILVVGGGDSAIEAALALAQQAGNKVTISYRKSRFVRLKTRNEASIAKAVHEGRVRVLFDSEVAAIASDCVRLKIASGGQQTIDNDDVFIFAGGDPPFPLLERAGVSFDPNDHPKPPEVVDPDTGLLSALTLTLACAIALIVWAWWFRAYYSVDASVRATSSAHRLLRPSGPVGVLAGLAGCLLFMVNLAYLIRRSFAWGRLLPGSLRAWMGCHVFSGLLAAIFVIVHAGFSIRPTVGGHAFVALAAVVLSGAIGRYLYALFPRAANGTEAGLDELRGQLAGVSAQWDREGRGFGTQVRQQIDELIIEGRWRASVLARVRMLVIGQFLLRRRLIRLRHVGQASGIPEHEIRHVLMLARKAHRLALLVTHYEEIGTALSSWRYFHRWLALLMVLLAIAHIVTATRYASLDFGFTRLMSSGVW